jgi:hypothetical protein
MKMEPSKPKPGSSEYPCADCVAGGEAWRRRQEGRPEGAEACRGPSESSVAVLDLSLQKLLAWFARQGVQVRSRGFHPSENLCQMEALNQGVRPDFFRPASIGAPSVAGDDFSTASVEFSSENAQFVPLAGAVWGV